MRNHVRSFPPCQSIAVLEDELPEPTWKGGVFAKLRQVSVGLDERVLGCILGQRKITQDGERVPDGHILESPDNDLERLRLPFDRPLDRRFPLFHIPPQAVTEGLLQV